MHPFLAALLGGVLIGLAATLLMLTHGRIMGVSGTLGGLLPPNRQRPFLWRVLFLLGIIMAPVAAHTTWGTALAHAPVVPLPLLVLAGFIVGLGTTLGSGCTSGHGVCGLARLSPRSLLATCLFMASAILTVYVMRHF